jgi:hypothetical protein
VFILARTGACAGNANSARSCCLWMSVKMILGQNDGRLLPEVRIAEQTHLPMTTLQPACTTVNTVNTLREDAQPGVTTSPGTSHFQTTYRQFRPLSSSGQTPDTTSKSVAAGAGWPSKRSRMPPGAGLFSVSLNGESSVHGVTQNQPVSARVTLNGDTLRAAGEFSVRQRRKSRPWPLVVGQRQERFGRW